MTIRRPRPGFTLIELLFVIGVMVVLASLGFLLIPNLDRNKGVANATTQLEGQIRLSRGQALRDGSPRGIRLIPDPNDATRVVSLEYIEQPDPVAPRGTNVRVIIQTVPDQSGNLSTGVQLTVGGKATAWDGVQVGDYFELTVSPTTIARIVPPPSGQTPNPAVLWLDRVVEGTENGSQLQLRDGFRVVRSPRALQGEPLLQMHKDVFIDLKNSQGITPNIDGNYDILFNSSGQVAHAGTGMIFLTVQHIDRPNDHLVVVIYTRTGKVTAVNVNDGGGDPFAFARDGKSSGL